MTDRRSQALRNAAAIRAKYQLLKKQRERRRWATVITLATIVTYALTFAHYGLGY